MAGLKISRTKLVFGLEYCWLCHFYYMAARYVHYDEIVYDSVRCSNLGNFIISHCGYINHELICASIACVKDQLCGYYIVFIE